MYAGFLRAAAPATARAPGPMSSQPWIETSRALPIGCPPVSRIPHCGPLNVVCFGGGTGLSTLLKSWKYHVRHPAGLAGDAAFFNSLTAVVAVSDNGGSSGR